MRALILLALAVPLMAAAQTPPSVKPVGPKPGPDKNEMVVTNPYQGDDAALQSGRKLFVAFNCSGCHGGHAGGGMGPSLRDEDWIHGNTAGDIFNSISQGRAHGMPSWGTMLPPQYIWQLVGYIQSMRTPQEPDPPR